jgi:hypothetical protein
MTQEAIAEAADKFRELGRLQGMCEAFAWIMHLLIDGATTDDLNDQIMHKYAQVQAALMGMRP